MPEHAGFNPDRDMFKNGMRIREVCDMLGIDDETARLMVHINNLSGESKKGIEVFEDQAVRDVALSLDEQNRRLGVKNPSMDVSRLVRMFSDEGYRQQMWELYVNRVLPVYQQRKSAALN